MQEIELKALVELDLLDQMKAGQRSNTLQGGQSLVEALAQFDVSQIEFSQSSTVPHEAEEVLLQLLEVRLDQIDQIELDRLNVRDTAGRSPSLARLADRRERRRR